MNGGDHFFQFTLQTDDVQHRGKPPSLENDVHGNITNQNQQVEFSCESPRSPVMRDTLKGSENSTKKIVRRKEALEGRQETRHTFPRPQRQLTLEEMIKDMLPPEQESMAQGKALHQSLAYKHGYDE